MGKILEINTSGNNEQQVADVNKKPVNQLDMSSNFAILMGEIIVENLLRKYKGKYSEVSFKDASAIPERLKRDKNSKEE